MCFFFFSSRRRHTRSDRDWSSDVCSSDLSRVGFAPMIPVVRRPVEPAMLEPGLAFDPDGHQVGGIERVEGDGRLRLTAEGAILVHPLVAIAVAARTAEGAGSNAQIWSGQVLSGAGGVCTLEALVTSADAERLPRGCDGAGGKERQRPREGHHLPVPLDLHLQDGSFHVALRGLLRDAFPALRGDRRATDRERSESAQHSSYSHAPSLWLRAGWRVVPACQSAYDGEESSRRPGKC